MKKVIYHVGRLLIASTALCASPIFATPALATIGVTPNATVRTLDSFVFADGSTATGYFIFDALTRKFGAYDITTSAGIDFYGNAFAGNHYMSGGPLPLATASPSYTPANDYDYTFYTDSSRNTFLNFQLDTALTSEADIRGLVYYDGEGAPSAELSLSNGFAGRVLASGQIVSSVSPPAVAAVPEPTTWAMMTLGFGAMGFAMRRKKVSTRVRFA